MIKEYLAESKDESKSDVNGKMVIQEVCGKNVGNVGAQHCLADLGSPR